MPGSHWLIGLTPENYQITRNLQFSLLGLHGRHRKKAERMIPGDRILYYVQRERSFPATTTVTSTYFEDRRAVWTNGGLDGDPFPYRVHTRPDVVLEDWEALDAESIAPRLLYLKRWPPETWYLGLHGDVHILSAQDFQFVEREMHRIIENRERRSERPPRFGDSETLTARTSRQTEL